MAKPVLPDIEVALIYSAWGTNRTCLQQTMPSSRMQACIRWQRSPRNRPPPGPRPSMGIHISMLINPLSSGAVPGAWMGATDQLLSSAKHNNASCSSAHCTSSIKTWNLR
eukprot:1151392-Pelagomonas_calceolata.AAC.5